MAEHQARLDGTPPLVHLQGESGLDRLSFGYSQPTFVAEGDRASVRAAGLDREASVLAFSHRAHVAEHGVGEHQRDGRVASPEGRHACQFLGKLDPKLRTGDDGVDPLAWDAIRSLQRARGVGVERLGKRAHSAPIQLHAGGRAVSSIADQMLRAGGQAGQQVVAVDAAS